jgi:hypothetical protein
MQENSDNLLPVCTTDYETLLAENQENGWRSIPHQTKLLVHEFVECSNVRKAAKKVGISLGRAQRILRDRLVDDYFHSIVDELRDISILNRSFLEQEYLMTLAQLNGDEEVPKMNRDGDMVWGKHFDGSAKVSLLKDMRGFIGIKDSSSDTKTVVQINFGAAGYREEHDPSVVIEGEVVGGD